MSYIKAIFSEGITRFNDDGYTLYIQNYRLFMCKRNRKYKHVGFGTR